MQLLNHEAEHFRNITSAAFAPAPSVTVICGENGQGKTNLLESVWLLCGGKSFRGAKDGELVQKGQSVAAVRAVFREENGNDTRVLVTVGGEGAARRGRFASVNGGSLTRASALAGRFCCVAFSPGHLSLVQGGPEGRRRFLDAALCQIYPGYVECLRRYNRALQQKNAALKQMDAYTGQDDLLAVFNRQMARAGAEIILRRAAYLQQAAPLAAGSYREISRGRESFSVRYISCVEPAGEGETEASLLALFKARESTDWRAGFSTAGPHREDILFEIDGADARSFASQGQQRSAVICLKLAEAELLHTAGESMPLVLLDDVLSELDAHRRDYLLNRLDGGQVILTCCEAELPAKSAGAVYVMEGGALRPG